MSEGQGLHRELRRRADFPGAGRLLNESSDCELCFCFVAAQSYSYYQSTGIEKIIN